MAKKYDDFDEEGQDGFFDQILTIVSKRKREFAIVSVVAAVVLLGVIVLGSYPDDEQTAATESVPIVRADAGDYKTTPDNPGGMEIPYRDSTVFSGSTDGGTENILADETTEEPVPRSQLFAGLNTEGEQPGGAPVDDATVVAVPSTTGLGEVEATQQALAKAAPVEAPSNDALVKEAIGVSETETTTAGEQEIAAAIVPSVEPPKAEPVEKVEAEKAAKAEPAAGSTAAAGVSPGGAYVQLASVKSVAGAAGEYKKLQAKYSGLSGLKFRTQEANLGAKGTFHRIQAGPMSKDDATRICNDIKKTTPGGCLVVTK